MPVWDRFTTLLVGGALSRAAGDALDPVFETTRQRASAERALKVVEPGTAAQAQAHGLEEKQTFTSYGADGQTVTRQTRWPGTSVDLQDDAKRHSIGQARFNLLTQLARAVPGWPETLALWRRRRIDEPTVDAVLDRHGMVEGMRPALKALKNDVLDPGQTAAAIHRGLIPDPGLLKGEQPQPPFEVEAYPVYPINAEREAEASGYDRNRLGVLVGLQGLPMGVIEAAQAFYRKIITHGDYIRAFNESNNRNEWADAVLQYARQIPTARDFFENALRGYHSLEWAQKQAERHGMTPADSLVIYQNQGRPMNIRQITQALSRGATFNPEPGELKDPYEASVVEGNIKPAYYELAKALKYTLPSPFVMRQLTASGVWSEAKAAKRLKDSGWIPQDADEAAHAWAQGTAATDDPHVSKAQTQLWTRTHNSYLAGEVDEATAGRALTQAGVTAVAVPQVLALWNHERELVRQQLTPTQIRKAYAKPVKNPRTGQPWTLQDAIDALVARGYSLADAQTFLAEA